MLKSCKIVIDDTHCPFQEGMNYMIESIMQLYSLYFSDLLNVIVEQ